MIAARYIAIAGMIATGKTTLARGIAKHLKWEYVPEPRNAVKYIDDLYKEPGRWAFEAQAAFLLEKVISANAIKETNHSLVLDRSFSEDAEVFAEYFRIQGHISERSFKTYTHLYNLVKKTLSHPDIIIICTCPAELVRLRIEKRVLEVSWSYPSGFLDHVSSLYELWFSRLKNVDYPVFTLDSAQFDFRQGTVVKKVCEEINQALVSSAKKNYFDRISQENSKRIMVRIC